MLEGIICPACEATLEEAEIRESLTCKLCKTDLQDRRFLDFLEFLMANGMVEDLDFFDQKSTVKMLKDWNLMTKKMLILMILRRKKTSLVYMNLKWKCINKRQKMKKLKDMKILKALKKNGKILTKGVQKNRVVENNYERR